jgi:pimeloyl-ACP methyl ester carboxylesterase
MILLSLLMGCLHFHEGVLPGEPPNANFAMVRDSRIRYVVEGEGSTVVFVHGFASSLGVWERLASDLSQDHRVVRMDLKGFGWSDRSEGDYSPKAQSEIVWALLDELGVDEFALVGHSWGSSVSLQMALDRPERIQKIVLYDGWVYEEQLPAFFIWSRNPVFGPTLFRLWYKERVDDRMAMAFYDPERYVTQDFAEHVESTLERPGSVRAALAAVETQLYSEVQQQYASIEVPTLLLWGEHDAVSPLWVGEQLASELPDSQLRTYGSCGHFPMIEAYGPSTNDLRAFLEAP